MPKYEENDVLNMELIHEPSGMKMVPIRAYKKDTGNGYTNIRWFVDIQFDDGVIVKDKSLASFLQRRIIHPEYYKGREHVEKSVIGKEIIANNGMKAKITKYFGRNKVEITFEDGTVSPTTSLGCFRIGEIIYKPLSDKRVGEKSESKDGETIEIIEYHGCNDVVIKFEDGNTMITTYWKFKHQKVVRQQIIDRLGEVSITPDGRKLTIIDYRNSHDIDVQLEDGKVLKNRQYRDFKSGLISGRQKIKVYNDEQYYQSNIDMFATVKDNTRGNITVELEDGTIKNGVDHKNLVKGVLKHPKFATCKVDHVVNGIKYYNCKCNICKENHVLSINSMKDFVCNNVPKHKEKRNLQLERQGEVIELPNGKQVTILNYRKSTDIDVEYEGKVYEHRRYGDVKRGCFGVNKEQIVNRLGEKSKNSTGDNMTIIGYRSATDIDVQFEDGTVVEHARYGNFVRGAVAKKQDNRLGEITTNKDGYSMKIIEYLCSTNITVQFEDGTIKKNRSYYDFKHGAILKDPRRTANTFKKNNLHKRIKTKFGLDVWFIDYVNQHDATIEFEDGTIIRVNNTYNVENGSVNHPKYLKVKLHHIDKDKIYYTCQCKVCHNKHILELNEMKDYICNDTQEKINKYDLIHNERIGKTLKYKDIMIKIIEYRRSEDLDVQFEDGTVVKHKRYRDFRDNRIRHPKYKDIIEAYNYKNERYFLCTCKKCKGKHVLALSEMKDFICTGKE